MYNLLNKSSVMKYDFYLMDPVKVANELLGMILVRRLGDRILAGKIVETEAYYGKEDPASRAFKGVNKISELMFGDCGKLLVYMVHANYLVNVVAHPLNEVGAVLIRAIEPLYGVEIMKINRNLDNDLQLCSGPGKLTQAFKIGKEHHGLDVTNRDSDIIVMEGENKKKNEIVESFRVGVSKDLDKPMRFYIKGNKWVSRK